jgi:DNA polymerase-4
MEAYLDVARQPRRGQAMPKDGMTILHVDMDAFYASIEQRDRPELRGRPVIVGGLEGRGVVCAASYEARPFGVHSAMPIATAQRLCPQAVFLPVRMKHYAHVGRQIRAILLSFTPLVEPLSLDEAFLDVRGCEELFGEAAHIAQAIKDRIRAEAALIASVGVAPNKFLAKLASDHGKPNGLVVVRPEQVTEFLSPLPVGRIWGIGAKGEKRLHALGIRTIGQVAAVPEQLLADHFGEAGRHIWGLARGHDDRTVVPDREAKSISTETTFARDIADRAVLRGWLLDQVDHLAARLRLVGVQARTVELKVRSSEFRTRIRALSLLGATNSTQALWHAALQLFERSITADILPVRLLGVGTTNLTAERIVQRELFEDEERRRQAALDQAVDTIRQRLGAAAIQRGSLLPRKPEESPDAPA